MRNKQRGGCSLIALAGLVFCVLVSGCILAPRQLAGPDCGRNACSPCPPPGTHHPIYRCPQMKGNPYVVYPPSGGTVSITPGAAVPGGE